MNIEKVNTANQRRKTFVELHSNTSLLELKLLYEIYKNKDWDALGFDRWQDYCESPIESGGLGISREWATQLVQVYKRYVIELHVPERNLLEISPRKLYRMKNLVNEENLGDMLEKAKTLSHKDLELEVREVDTTNCTHPSLMDDDAEFIHKCPICLSWVKVKKSEL